jgi:hypothetical protein
MFKSILLSALLLAAPATQPANIPAPIDPATEAVVDKVMKTAGSDVWAKVKVIEFTFNVEDEGKQVVSRSHKWDIVANTDTITDNIKKGDPVIVDLGKNAPAVGYQQWTNDSYWLLMPLKLKDGGVQFGPMMMTRDMPPSRANVTMSFADVGITPGDQYDLSINLRTNQIDHWVYRPNAEKKLGFTWEDYKDFNGLVLATNHVSDDKKRRIYFTDIRVEK